MYAQWLDELYSSRSGKRKSWKRGDKEERGERKKRTDGRQIIRTVKVGMGKVKGAKQITKGKIYCT